MDNGASSYRRFLNGEDSAFDDIMNELFYSLVFFINRYVHDVHTAEDIAIDTLADLGVHRHKYNFKVTLKTYLFMVGRSRALNYIKHRKKLDFVELTEVENSLSDGHINVDFIRTINGYRTTEWMSISFDKNQKIWAYQCKPDVFDGIDISNLTIDEKAIIDQVNSNSIATRGEHFGHNEIQSMQLTVKDSKLIMIVGFIEYTKSGERLMPNGIARNDIQVG